MEKIKEEKKEVHGSASPLMAKAELAHKVIS